MNNKKDNNRMINEHMFIDLWTLKRIQKVFLNFLAIKIVQFRPNKLVNYCKPIKYNEPSADEKFLMVFKS